LVLFGNSGLVTAGNGNDFIFAVGNHDTVSGDGGANTEYVFGNDDLVNAGGGNSTIGVFGDADTVAGGGQALIYFGGTGHTFVDTGPGFEDTVVGFDFGGGDTIQTPGNPTVVAASATQVGNNTVITFGDHSTLTLVGVTATDVTASWFHS